MRTLLSLIAIALPLMAQQTPPMGWHSGDSEAEFKANAAWMAQHLKRLGWEYAVVDLPAASRFPSGLKPLADWVHGQGLKFGVQVIRGIPRAAVAKNAKIASSQFTAGEAGDKNDTCPWNSDNYGVRNTPAGQDYYESIAKLYASWGVDLVQMDCIAPGQEKGAEVQMFGDALRRTGRPIILSTSPGPSLANQRAQMTLAAISHSPMLLSGNLTRMDAALFANEEVITVHQQASNGRAVINNAKQAVWAAKGKAAVLYVALFNLSDAPQTVTYPVQTLGLGTSGQVRDLWERKDLGRQDLLKAVLQPRAAALYAIKP